MNHFRRVVSIIICISFVFITTTAQAQSASNYTITSGSKILTLVPRPDLGFVTQPNNQSNTGKAFGGMLSTAENVETKQIRGLNGRSISVLMNNSTDKSNSGAFEILQSQNQNGYKAPLFTINGNTVAIIPEIVVRLAFENAYQNLQAICKKENITIKQKMDFTDKEYLLEVHGTNADSVFNAVELLKNETYIEWAVPNIASQPIFTSFSPEDEASAEPVIPNDKYFEKQWHLYNTGQKGGAAGADINAPQAWKITTGDPNIIIAVIDTGVDINHPDLVNNLAPGYDFFDDDDIPAPYLGKPMGAHGTMCAGLAAAQGNNSIGVSGVAWNCKIMPIRIANADDFVTDADLATAFRWAAEHGADILSNSWGGGYSTQVLSSAIRDITKQNGIGRNGKGCIVCFAAGNWEDGGPVDYPASLSDVIAVGATDHKDEVWYYSASGPELDIVAPSGGTVPDYYFSFKPFLWTTDITGIYGYSIYNLNSEDPNLWDYSNTMSGTSGACPIVAGVAALVLSVDPNLTNVEVRRILLDSAVDLGAPGRDDYYGYGRVDANQAVAMALNPPDVPDVSTVTLYVDDDAPDDPCAGNPEFSDLNEDGTVLHPFDSIQKAIDYALFSETILVLPGTYTGTGNHDINFMGKAVKLISNDGPKTCIIDCQNHYQGFSFDSGEGAEAKLEGFTIKNGKAFYGAGIHCIDGSNPTIANCIISDCLALVWGENGGSGGGLYLDSDSNPAITNCLFKGNMASLEGGAVMNYYSNPTFVNCSFIDNSCGDMGAGIFNLSGSVSLTNCIFTGNAADYEGGATYNEASVIVINNCTFTSNSAPWGTAIACDYYYTWWDYECDLTIHNSIIWDGISSIEEYDATINATYSNIPSLFGTWEGVGNINVDPEFADTAKGDVHLKSRTGRWNPLIQKWVTDNVTSPCIDAGDPASDFSNEPDPNGGRINMGAYGGTSEASMSDEQSNPVNPDSGSKASNPNPPDDSYCTDSDIALSWTAGADAVQHDVYLGTNISAIYNATRGNPMGVLKSKAQDETSFDPGTLGNYEIYYWRIDEILSDDSIIKGDMWTFITIF
jgi:thermitase